MTAPLIPQGPSVTPPTATPHPSTEVAAKPTSTVTAPPAVNETRQILSADAPASSLTFPPPGPSVQASHPPQPADHSPEIEAAKAHLNERFQTLVRDNPEGLKALLTQVYGHKTTPEQLDQLMQQARDGNLPMPEMRFVPAEQLQGHHAAYAASEGVIYLSENLRNEPGLLNAVVEAEIGHHLDQILGGDDTPGDEGQMLAIGLAQGGGALSAEDLQAARELSDHKTMEIDGKQVEVETIAPAVAAGIWWAGQVTAKTGVDAAIDYAIAAVLGVPPPGAASHIGNALANAVPGLGYWRTSRKLQRLARAINEFKQSFASLARIPGGQQIQARFNAAATAMQNALRNGDVLAAKGHMDDMVAAIGEAHAARAAGRVGSPPTPGRVTAPSTPSGPTGPRRPDGPSAAPAARTITSSQFYREISNLPTTEKIARIRTRAREYADSQNWTPRPDLRQRNGGRDIYYDERNRRYLAVDRQHGDFEILDRRGRHQGSMNLWGEVTDRRHRIQHTDGSHDIFVN